MIIKSFSLNYEKLFEDYKIIHVYGENFHLKNEIINFRSAPESEQRQNQSRKD